MWFLSYAGFKARKKNESFFENYVGNEFKIRVRDDFFIFQNFFLNSFNFQKSIAYSIIPWIIGNDFLSMNSLKANVRRFSLEYYKIYLYRSGR